MSSLAYSSHTAFVKFAPKLFMTLVLLLRELFPSFRFFIVYYQCLKILLIFYVRLGKCDFAAINFSKFCCNCCWFLRIFNMQNHDRCEEGHTCPSHLPSHLGAFNFSFCPFMLPWTPREMLTRSSQALTNWEITQSLPVQCAVRGWFPMRALY